MDLDFLESMVGEVVEESPYRDIWVVAEKEGDALAPVVLGMLGQSRQLSDSLGVYVKAVFLGESAEELRQGLLRLKERGNNANGKQHLRRGKVVDIVGAKGGVGTTTIAVNLAASLARAHVVSLYPYNSPIFDERRKSGLNCPHITAV